VQDLKQFQLDDEVLRPLLKAVEGKQRPPPSTTQGKSREFHLLLQKWNQLYTRDGLLFRRYEYCHGEEKWAQLVVPLALQKEILHDLHSGAAGGNLGEDKIVGRLHERFYWPGHTDDARKWCQKCPERTMRKTPAHRTY